MSTFEDRASAVARSLARHQVNPDGEFSPESLLSCAEDLINHGLAFDARALLLNASDELGRLSRGQQIRHAANLARAHYLTGNESECLQLARRTLALPFGDRALEPRATSWLRVYEGAALTRLSRAAEAIACLKQLRNELLLGPDSIELAACCHYLATVCIAVGLSKEASDYSQEAVVSARRAGSGLWQGLALMAQAQWQRANGRFVAAVDSAVQSISVLSEAKSWFALAAAHRNAGIGYFRRGKLEEAQRQSEACLEVCARAELDSQARYAYLLMALVACHAGDFKRSLGFLDEVGSEPDSPVNRLLLLRQEAIVDLALERADAASAGPEADRLAELAMSRQPTSDIAAGCWRRIAEAQLLGEWAKDAPGLCLRSIAACTEIGDRYEEAATYRVLALAQAKLGQHELAKKAFDQGFALYDEIETPFEWGKLWLAYGDWLSADDSGSYRNLSAAHEAYRVAIDHFEGMGAEYRLGQARARLEALDARVRSDGEELQPTRGKVRPVRKPRHSAETLRRAQWALETYGIVTRDRSMLEQLVELEAVAKSDMPIMVLGESGTGKELIAQGAHKLSGRVGRMIAINCSAIPASMLESEIFGHVKGAFTNAVADKPGLFELADGGTIFLDEIGEMPLDLQAKLLRVLETRTARRVGGTEDIRVRARVVAATNRDKVSLQNGNGFRSDLYFRLAHAVYDLPALRQRGDDVELLLEHFLAHFNREHGKSARFTPAARHRLCDYAWPGNIRQLRAVVEKMVVAARPDGAITPRDVPVEDAGRSATGMMAELDAEEARRIRKALADANNVKTAAAEILGISRTTLLGKMKRLGIE